MDINTLEEFVSLYETLSFQETADRLSVSQSALTKHIHKLEEELGVSLFNRSTRSVRLNEYSELFYPYAVQMVRFAKEGIVQLNDLAKNCQKNLQLAFTSACSQYGVIELISAFTKNYPQFNTKITESFRVSDLILSHSCDFGFASEASPIDDRLVKIPYKVDHLAAFVHSDNPIASGESISVGVLKNLPCIAHSRANGLYHLDTLKFSAACRSYGFEPNFVISASFTSTIMKLVKEKQGIAILNRAQLPADQLDAEISVLDLEPSIESTIYFLYDKDSKKTPARSAFLNYLIGIGKTVE